MERGFNIFSRLITSLFIDSNVIDSLSLWSTLHIVEWSERMSSDDIGLNSINFFEHLQYFSPIGIWIFYDLFRGRLGTE